MKQQNKHFPMALNASVSAAVAVAIVFQGSYFYFQHMSVVCLLLALLIWYAQKNKVTVSPALIVLSAAMILVNLLPVATANAGFFGAATESLRWLGFAVIVVLSDNTLKNKMLAGVYAGVTLVSAMGILAYFKILRFPEWAAEIDGMFRMQSSVGYANLTAVYCGIGAMLAYAYFREDTARKKLHLWCLLINLAGLILTFSRFGIACFAASVAIAVCFKHRRAVWGAAAVFLLAVGGAAYLFASGKEALLMQSTLVSRLIYWQDALSLFLSHPIGIGAGEWQTKQFAVQSMGYNVKYIHNSLLQIAVDNGILGMIFFVPLPVFGFLGLYRLWRGTGKDLHLALIASLILLVMHSTVDIDMSFGATLLILGILLGYGAKRRVAVKKQPLIAVSALLITVAVTMGVSVAVQNAGGMDYEALLEKNAMRPNDALVVAQLSQMAYARGDNMETYRWSKEWVRLAPRQQAAYDACFVALEGMKEAGIYQTERDALYAQAKAMNETTNSLCRYYDSYTNIVLPKK